MEIKCKQKHKLLLVRLKYTFRGVFFIVSYLIFNNKYNTCSCKYEYIYKYAYLLYMELFHTIRYLHRCIAINYFEWELMSMYKYFKIC